MTKSKTIKKIRINVIRTDGGTQPRAEIDDDLVTDYARDMESGVVLPPVTVYHDGKDYWLADGFHRYFACVRIDQLEVAAEIIEGTRRDAILHSTGANATHGKRRSIEDKRNAVMTILNDDEWSQWSDAHIAKHLRIDAKTVAKYRKEASNGTTPRTVRTVQRGGKTYKQQTEKIGVRDKLAQLQPDGRDHPDMDTHLTPDETPTGVKAQIPLDALDKPIPDHLRVVFTDGAPKIMKVQDQIKEVGKAIDTICSTPAGTFLNHQQVTRDLKNAWNGIKFSIPYTACPWCGGEGDKCQPCKGQGWVPKEVYERHESSK